MAIDAGARNCWVTVERNTPTRTGAAQVPSWSTLFGGYARISTSGGREFHQARAHHAELSHEISILFRRDVSPRPADRIVYGSRIFDVLAIFDRDERHEEWVIHARELT